MSKENQPVLAQITEEQVNQWGERMTALEARLTALEADPGIASNRERAARRAARVVAPAPVPKDVIPAPSPAVPVKPVAPKKTAAGIRKAIIDARSTPKEGHEKR